MKFQNIIQPFYFSFPLLFPSSTYGLKPFEKTESFLRKGEDGRKDIAHGRSLTNTSEAENFYELYQERVDTLVADLGPDIMEVLVNASIVSTNSDGSLYNDGVRSIYYMNEIYKKLGISGSFELSDPCGGEYGTQMCEARTNAIAVCQQDPTCDDILLASIPYVEAKGSVLLETGLASMVGCLNAISPVFYNHNTTLDEWQTGITQCNFIIEQGNLGTVGYENITQNIQLLQGFIGAYVGFDNPILNLGNTPGITNNELYITFYCPPQLEILEDIMSENGSFDVYVLEVTIYSFLTWPAKIDQNPLTYGLEVNFREESIIGYVFAKYSDYVDGDITGFYAFRGSLDSPSILFGIVAANAITPQTFEQLYAVQDDILEVASSATELEYEVQKFVFDYFLE